ncbi:MAG: sterol desaturase family protein [Myxococcales bacterium]|nr:sterol desaturase family protein [Myxococcales bacterium]
MSTLIYWSFPIFIVTLILERLWAGRATREGREIRGYQTRDTFASLSMGLGNVLIASVFKVFVLALHYWLYEHRVFDLQVDAAWVWVALFFAEDLCYYAFHRAGHEVRFFWAGHVNHHSSRSYNLSTALRQSWTGPLIGFIFWLPLPFLGFHPLMLLTQQAVSLLYQYWLHTEAIDRMPAPFEAVFNTPSHHRVHHGRNPLYLDRNYAGILIIWDRLFGTFEPERERPDYGLTHNLETYNPLRIAFHEWADILRDVRAARGVREVLGRVFGPPGWQAESKDETAAGQRRRATLEPEAQRSQRTR